MNLSLENKSKHTTSREQGTSQPTEVSIEPTLSKSYRINSKYKEEVFPSPPNYLKFKTSSLMRRK